jgi:prepilin-type N-terminal cleavage/methylation domain-containing protein
MQGYPLSHMNGLIERLRDERGMTLVELLTVLSVVGILFAIAAPAIQNHIALQEMRSSARQVLDVLREARSAAVDEGAPRYVLFTPPRTYRVFRYDGADWVAETQAEVLPTSISFSDADVTFPGLTDEPEVGAPAVPANAAYFGTRGGYPDENDVIAETYSLTINGGVGRVETLTLHTTTGQVTGL